METAFPFILSKETLSKFLKNTKLFDVKNTCSTFLVDNNDYFGYVDISIDCGCFPSMNNNEMSPFKSVFRTQSHQSFTFLAILC